MKITLKSPACWYMPVIAATREAEQKNGKLAVHLDNSVRLCLKIK